MPNPTNGSDMQRKDHRFLPLDELRSLVGHETGVSDWLTITQQQVNAFADITGDWQFIHVDPEAAAETPFGTTIAHGFLTMSLMSWFGAGPRPRIVGQVRSVNYGLDRIRFVSPVPIGSRIRGRFALAELEELKPNEITTHWDVTVEVEGSERPAVVARWLNRAFLA